MKTIARLLALCAFALFLVGCEDPLYQTVVAKTAAEKAASSGVYPSAACVDKSSTLKIVFKKSMDPSTLSYSGSIARGVSRASWSTTDATNDTLTFTPKSSWAADESLGPTTGSLYVRVKDTEGWPCEEFAWTPEILDGIVYVNKITGSDWREGGGSALKPFYSMKTAMHAIYMLYPSSSAEIHLSGGMYSNETEVDALYINSPLAIRGGYDPENWSKRDPVKFTSIIYSCEKDESPTVSFNHVMSGILDGITIRQAKIDTDQMVNTVYVSNDSTVFIRDCVIENICLTAGYTAEAIVSLGKLSLSNTSIAMKVRTNGTSIAISANGDLSVNDCSIDISDTEYNSGHIVIGILARSNTIIQSSSIKISSNYSSSDYGIALDTDEDSVSGFISGNKIEIGDPLSSPVVAYAIRLENVSDYSIVRNSLNIPAKCSSISTGVYLSDCSNVLISTNAIHGGEGSDVECVTSVSSTKTEVIANTLFLGSAGKYTASKAKGISIRSSTVAKCVGNIIFGDNRFARADGRRYGIYLSSSSDRISEIANNAFANLSDGIIYNASGKIVQYAASASGLASLNADYNANNLYYDSASSLGLTDYSADVPLYPTSATPKDITQSSLTSAPETDITGRARTAPYSIGAYEFD